MIMDQQSVLTAYRRQAPFYDAVFGTLLGPGRRLTVQLANRIAQNGASILEVGVGTGLSLPRYRRDLRITGIDLSGDMLDIARERAKNLRLPQVENLIRMDAEAMDFADSQFDMVCAMYVASVVPSPSKLISEIERVCKPGGDVLIVNHFADPRGVRGWAERRLAPLSAKLGWRPDFDREELLRGSRLEILAEHKVAPLNLFTVLHARNGKAA